jgi:hypothetical protein
VTIGIPGAAFPALTEEGGQRLLRTPPDKLSPSPELSS